MMDHTLATSSDEMQGTTPMLIINGRRYNSIEEYETYKSLQPDLHQNFKNMKARQLLRSEEVDTSDELRDNAVFDSYVEGSLMSLYE